VIAAENLAPIEDVRPLLDEANQLVAIFTTSVKKLRQAIATGTVGALLFLYWLSYLYF
jgi:hypothetical protein